MRYICQAVPERQSGVDYLKARIPNLEVVYDKGINATHTFLETLRVVGEDPAVHIEDDITLTKNFINKAEKIIRKHPDWVIQFFSMRNADLYIGSRIEPGRTYLMNQCWYSPKNFCDRLLLYFPTWRGAKTNIGGQDLLVRDFLRDNKMSYIIIVPSLVQHEDFISAISNHHKRGRRSQTFIDPDGLNKPPEEKT